MLTARHPRIVLFVMHVFLAFVVSVVVSLPVVRTAAAAGTVSTVAVVSGQALKRRSIEMIMVPSGVVDLRRALISVFSVFAATGLRLRTVSQVGLRRSRTISRMLIMVVACLWFVFDNDGAVAERVFAIVASDCGIL